MTPLQVRKSELLVTSAINREVLRLEADSLRRTVSWLKPDRLLQGNRKFIVPIAGLLLAWNLRRVPSMFKGPFAIMLLRKLWEAISQHELGKKRGEQDGPD